MNYKINQLSKPVKCELTRFPDIAALKYGHLSNDKSQPLVFDVTSFCEATGEEVDVNVFMKSQRLYIDRLVQVGILKAGELFYVDKNKRVYMIEGLEPLFLMYASKTYQIYFYELLGEIMTTGVAVSDGFVLKMALDRIPSETLQEIIRHRNEQEET